MKESDIKKIYYDLRTNDVSVDKKENSLITYTFGHYRVNYYYDYINICKKTTKKNGVFTSMNGAEWDDDFPKNYVYEIAVAAQNKSQRKEYTDPYKDIPSDVEIKNLTGCFGTELLKNAGEFLPVDMSKKEAFQVIKALKQDLTQKLQEFYIRKM